MLLAIKNNKKIYAEPKKRAICPLCNGEVIAKCGEIKIWHWAHKSRFICDSFGEVESEWHLKWKKNFPKEMQEFKFENHFADIYNKKQVIELQSTSLSPKQIIEREKFYRNMIWILNGKTLCKNLYYFKVRYNWKWFPQSWGFATKPIYIDEGDKFLYLLEDIGSRGHFKKISKDAFIIENGGNPYDKHNN
jgi:competence CoiA-like predicted nuclease